MKKSNKFLGFFFLGIALLSIFFAVICFFFADDSYTLASSSSSYKETYGADYYTDVQNGVAQTVKNTWDIALTLSTMMEYVCLMGAFAFIVTALLFTALGIDNLRNKEKKAMRNQYAAPMPQMNQPYPMMNQPYPMNQAPQANQQIMNQPPQF